MSRDKTDRISVEEYRALMANPISTNKFNATGMRLDGHWFDSTIEANRYQVLKVLERSGHIKKLRVHPRYEISPAGVFGGVKQRATYYEADFEYEHNGQIITEDVKGLVTGDAVRKMKDFAAKYDRQVKIVKDYKEQIGGMEP